MPEYVEVRYDPNMEIQCLVSCYNSNGVPALYPVVIKCLDEQYSDGVHYDEAREKAASEGYDIGFYKNYPVFDEYDDIPAKVWNAFDWKSAPVIDCRVL